MRRLPPVSPVFDRRYQVVAFVTFILLSLIAPLVIPLVIPIERRYEAIQWNLGNYPFIREQIFATKGPIDILFVGPSAVWTGVDPVLVQEAVKARLQREAAVLNFGTDFYGHEAAYFLVRDTLATRQVRVVVLGVPSPPTRAPHVVTPHLVDVYRDAALLRSLPLEDRLIFYTSGILGAPRDLLSAVRPNSGLGAFASGKHQFSRSGQGQNYDTRALADADAAQIVTSEPAGPRGESLLSRGDPRIRETPAVLHQEKLLRAIEALCRRHGTRLVLIKVPLQDDDAAHIELPSSDLLDGQLKVIAPTPHFMTLPPAARASYYRNAGHLNYRGAVLFSNAAVPALLRMLDEQSN
jgi:hypothetical protein